MTHPSESAHYYQPDGTPAYEVPNKSKTGQMRPVTLRDARSLGLYPGTSAILRRAHNEDLENWKFDRVVEAAVTRINNSSVDDIWDADANLRKEWIESVKQIAKDQVTALANRGTEIHAKLQGYYTKDSEEFYAWDDPINLVANAIDAQLGVQDWKPEVACAHPLGYGTKADLVSDSWVLDFKTKDFDESGLEKLDIYESHWMQLAATKEAVFTLDYKANGFNAKIRRCAIVYVSRTVPGLCKIIAATPEQLGRGFSMFRHLHGYWCDKNNYYPAGKS